MIGRKPEENPDSGNFTRKRDLVTGYLPQVFELEDKNTALHNAIDGGKHIVELIEKYESAPADSTESAALLDKITHLDGWDLERRAGIWKRVSDDPVTYIPTGCASTSARTDSDGTWLVFG